MTQSLLEMQIFRERSGHFLFDKTRETPVDIVGFILERIVRVSDRFLQIF